MGQAAGTVGFSIAGNVIGSFLGGPVGGQIGQMAGGLIGSMIFGRHKSPIIPDFPLAGSSYGKPIPLLYGSARLPGLYFWQSGVTTKYHGIGKGGLMSPTNPVSYYRSLAAGFCVGPASLVKVWLDGTLFWDSTATIPHEYTFQGGGFAMRSYQGTPTQLPDYEIVAWANDNVAPEDGGSSGVPGYRDLAYILCHQIDMAAYGMRIPNISAMWSTSASQTTVFAKLQRFNPDINSDTPSPAFAASLGVDWQRGVVCSLASDGVLRSFTLGANTCNAAVSMPSAKGIAMGNGTALYAFSGLYGGLYNTSYMDIYKIDPVSLALIGTTSFALDAVGLGSHGTPNVFLAINVPAPSGAFDMIAGSFGLLGGAGFVLNPSSGVIAAVGPMPLGSYFASGACCFGSQDTATGDTDVWFTNWDYYDPTETLWLLKTTITASDWSPQNATTPLGLVEDLLDATPNMAFSFKAAITAAVVGSAGGHAYGIPVYDGSDGSIIVYSCQFEGVASFKYVQGTGIVWTSTATAGAQGNSQIDMGTMGAGWGGGGGGIVITETGSGSSTLSPVPSGSPAPVQEISVQIYDSYSQSLVFWASDGEIYLAYVNRTTNSSYPVASILSDLCVRAGLTSAQIDVSTITDTVAGYVVNTVKSMQECIADVLECFQIDVIESDYKLKFVKRGQPSVAAITEDQLASTDSQDPGNYWNPTRTQQQEMPLQLNLRFQDPALDYQPNATYSKRTQLPLSNNLQTVWSKRVMTVDLPVITDSLSAKTIADVWLYSMWAERDTYTTALSPQFLALDPGDMVTVTMNNGDSYQVRLQSMEIGADYTVHLKANSEDASTYVANSSANQGAAVSYQPATIQPSSFLEFFPMQVPLLQDSDDLGGSASRIYYAAAPLNPANASIGRLYQALTPGNFTLFDTLSGFPTWGYAQNALGSTSGPFSVDQVNTLTVLFTSGDAPPASCAYADLMNGANALVVDKEIIQFQTVTDNADGSVTLSTLLRGRRGTEGQVGNHQVGDVVILLVAGEIGANSIPLSQIGATEYYKLVPQGRFIDQTPSNAFAYLGYDLFPYAPVQIARAASGSDLVLSWIRRTRLGGLLVDGTDTVPLGEEAEVYEVYILASAAALAAFNPTQSSTYVRAFLGLTAPTVTYTAAEMSADGFTPATETLYLCVYQVSQFIGRGFQAYAALAPF